MKNFEDYIEERNWELYNNLFKYMLKAGRKRDENWQSDLSTMIAKCPSIILVNELYDADRKTYQRFVLDFDEQIIEIEELGWEFDYGLKENGVQIYYFFFHDKAGNIFSLSTSSKYTKIIIKGIDKDSNETLFRGKIRNSEELKTLMRQLEIK